MSEDKAKAKRGFAAMSAEKQREIASLGGKSAHAKGTARIAGSKGGKAARVKRLAGAAS